MSSYGLKRRKSHLAIQGIKGRGLFRSWLDHVLQGGTRHFVRNPPTGHAGATQERSAALPLGKGAAALLGVLASCSGNTQRNYCRQEPFCAAPLPGICIGFRANFSDSYFRVHSACLLSGGNH
jgi:hypothetical protein